MTRHSHNVKPKNTGFISAFLSTFISLLKDKGVFTIMISAPIFYALYYPWPYSTQIARHIPVAIIDHANDSLSRQVIRYVSASPSVTMHLASDERTVQQQLLNHRIMAYMVIPPNLRSDVLKGQSKAIVMVGNASYLVASKNAQSAMAQAILAVSDKREIKVLSTYGLSETQATAVHDPVPLLIAPINNRNEGYGSYVVPAVAWLVLQQTLLIACAMLVGGWLEVKSAYASPKVWLGRIAALSLIHYVICLGCTGWMFSLWGYAAGGNSLGNLLLISLFSPCVAAVGFLLGIVIRDRERAMQLLMFTALPIFFVSGFSWPTQQLPEVLQYLRWIFPSTSAIRAGVSLNQLGASVGENGVYFLALAVIIAVTLTFLFWFGREKSTAA